MIERFCKVGEIELCFETFGSATDPTVLLITALGGQLVHWPAGFCGALAARGFHVVRYDNRDAGRSTWLDHLGRHHAALRELAGAAFDRGVHPEGAWRQLAAIFAAGDRTPRLRRIEAPAVVVHGDADRVLPLSGGEATAAAIPGARLHVIPGMGHDLPRGAWGRIVDAIADNAAVRVS